MKYDAGNAGEVLKAATDAVEHGTTFTIIIDQVRTLRIVHTSHSATETWIMARDDESDAFVTLFIPRDGTQRARADVTNTLSA